jgi:hypothetical protein
VTRQGTQRPGTSVMAARWAWSLLVVLAVLPACTTLSRASVGDVKSLAGGWEGRVDTGYGGRRMLTITVAENGAYEALAADGGRTTGMIVLGDGHLRWSDTSGASGSMRLYEGANRRLLRGQRADGTLPFEWTQPWTKAGKP